ncbi:MAG: capsular biosynthesis protein [Ruminococcaceae bacterium]|nr:capsular biosynthesis protein [Oscillospiraceae bacterium]
MGSRSIKEKLADAAASGQVVRRAGRRLHSLFPLYRISGRGLVFENYTDREYRRLEKKYRSVVNAAPDAPAAEQQVSNKVWICWLQGWEQAPDIVKAAISSVRENMPGREVVLLTEENIPLYAQFSEAITKKRAQGRISDAHFSDLLRTELLCRHGGMWIDATVLCTCSDLPDYITDAPLFVYKSIDLTGMDTPPVIASSWLISARSNHPILLLTRELLQAYWEDHRSLSEYFVFHIFFAMAARRYPDLWNAVPTFSNACPHILAQELCAPFSEERWEQLRGMSAFHKLSHHVDYPKDGGSFCSYIIHRYLHR